MKFYWDPREQSTKRHPVNIRFPTTHTLVQHIGEVRRVRIEIKHLYLCFIAEILAYS